MNIQPTPEMQAIMRENDLLDQLATLRSALADRDAEILRLRSEVDRAGRETLDLILKETNTPIDDGDVGGRPFDVLRRVIERRNELKVQLADRERELGETKAKCASVEAAYSILSNSGKTFFDLAHDLKDASARAGLLQTECDKARAIIDDMGRVRPDVIHEDRLMYHAARSAVDAHRDLEGGEDASR